MPLLLKFLGCAVFMVAACGCGREPKKGGGHAATTKSDQSVADLEAKLRFHGFHEPADLKRLLGELRDAAHRGDKTTLVNAIHYPFTTYDRGSPVREYASHADVLDDYDTIFSAVVLDALRGARYISLFVRDQGAMVGRGAVWLFQYDEGVRIKAINSNSPR